MASTQKGNCYLCGAELGKTAMKNHLLKAHACQGDGQDCRLLKIEGAYDKDYWLYIEVPASSSLTVVDTFLRKIWLECCGHMSAFSGPGYYQIAKSSKLKEFSIGAKLLHEYDFGSTTESLITFVCKTKREGNKRGVRLLARNIPMEYPCWKCGAEADWIDVERMYEDRNPFLCDACAEECGAEMLLPVTNSPRMGVCGYCGEQDKFSFVRPEIMNGGTDK